MEAYLSQFYRLYFNITIQYVTMKNLQQESKIGRRLKNYQVSYFLLNSLTDDISVK